MVNLRETLQQWVSRESKLNFSLSFYSDKLFKQFLNLSRWLSVFEKVNILDAVED